MRRKTQILNSFLLISGLIHISGILTNWEYDVQAGLVFIIPAIIWFINDYFKNGKTFSTNDSITIISNRPNWNVLAQIPAFLVLLYLYIFNSEQIPVSILLTLMIYFLIRIVVDFRKSLEISNHYIDIYHNRIQRDSISFIDFRGDRVILVRRHDSILHYDIPHSHFSAENLEILLKGLKKMDNGNQHSV